MKKLFDKEGLIDTLHTMYTQGKIAKSDYRIWFYLNNKTKISILTPLGETDRATIINGIGQGSFAAALASSITIGTAVGEITKGEVTAKIGNIELNSLIFQDNIAKMNFTLKDARNCARYVGWMLESKQLRANTSISKFVIMAPPKSRRELLKEVEANPIKMGETIIENSRTKKYLGDQIHEDGTAASIDETLNYRIPIAYERGEEILYICNQPSLIGFNIASWPVEQYESKISSECLANSD